VVADLIHADLFDKLAARISSLEEGIQNSSSPPAAAAAVTQSIKKTEILAKLLKALEANVADTCKKIVTLADTFSDLLVSNTASHAANSEMIQCISKHSAENALLASQASQEQTKYLAEQINVLTVKAEDHSLRARVDDIEKFTLEVALALDVHCNEIDARFAVGVSVLAPAAAAAAPSKRWEDLSSDDGTPCTVLSMKTEKQINEPDPVADYLSAPAFSFRGERQNNDFALDTSFVVRKQDMNCTETNLGNSVYVPGFVQRACVSDSRRILSRTRFALPPNTHFFQGSPLHACGIPSRRTSELLSSAVVDSTSSCTSLDACILPAVSAAELNASRIRT
jgi:hypothetical protein